MSAPKPAEVECEAGCGATFVPRRRDQRTCGAAKCRKAVSRASVTDPGNASLGFRHDLYDTDRAERLIQLGRDIGQRHSAAGVSAVILALADSLDELLRLVTRNPDGA